MDSPSATATTNPYPPSTLRTVIADIANEAIERHHALHTRGEFAFLLGYIDQIRPRVVLEIGTWGGGSAWAFSRLGGIRKIVTVDNAPQSWAPHELAVLPCEAIQVTGDSTHPDTIRQVIEQLHGDTPDLLFVDGGHDYATARADFENYGKMVHPGGLIIMHDTQGFPGNDLVQVPKLWAEIRQNYRVTEIIDTPGGPGGTGIIWL